MELTKQPDFNDEEFRRQKSESCQQRRRETTNIMETLSVPSSINNVLQMGDDIRRLELVNLKNIFQSAEHPSPLHDGEDASTAAAFKFATGNDWHTQTFSRKDRHDD